MVQIIDLRMIDPTKTIVLTYFYYHKTDVLYKINNWKITEPKWKILLPPALVPHCEVCKHRCYETIDGIRRKTKKYKILQVLSLTMENRWIANYGVKHPDSDIPTDHHNIYPNIWIIVPDPDPEW